MTLESGQLIHDRFEILGKLGAGGMACVYKAHDRKLSKDVALKYLNSDQLNHPARIARFKQEFTILSHLHHPHIASVFELIEIESTEIFYSMELLDGVSLADKITQLVSKDDSEQELSTSQLLEILYQVASALSYIHEARMIYCDLKPANVILLSTPIPFVKLIDFGIAKIMDQSDTEAVKAAMVGTSYYMSPEQIRSEKLDQRSDIYSFGVFAFELSTGKVPFNDPSLFSITASHLIGKIPSIKKFNHDLPSSFDRMIKVCMEKEKEDRYDDVKEIMARLSELKQKPTKPSLLDRILLSLRS